MKYLILIESNKNSYKLFYRIVSNFTNLFILKLYNMAVILLVTVYVRFCNMCAVIMVKILFY